MYGEPLSKWTDEEIQTLKDKYLGGATASELSEEYGVSTGNLYTWMSTNKVSKNGANINRTHTGRKAKKTDGFYVSVSGIKVRLNMPKSMSVSDVEVTDTEIAVTVR